MTVGGPAADPADAAASAPGRTVLLRFCVGLVDGPAPGGAPLAALALPHPLRAGARNGCGAALNLAVAQQLAQAMGSCLCIDAGGPSERLYVECAARVCDEVQVALPMPEHAEPADLGDRWRVIITGEPDLASELLTELLGNGGFEVCRAPSSGAALKLLERMRGSDGGVERVLVFTSDAAASRPLATDPWDLLQKIAQCYAGRMPPVILHAARPLRRPPGVTPALEFAAILYRPLCQRVVFDALEPLMSRQALPAVQAAVPAPP